MDAAGIGVCRKDFTAQQGAFYISRIRFHNNLRGIGSFKADIAGAAFDGDFFSGGYGCEEEIARICG